MEDAQIVELYFARSEQAIVETDTKYGGYCYSIAYNILVNAEDAEESVSDTYLVAWRAMPPRRWALPNTRQKPAPWRKQLSTRPTTPPP